MKIRQLLKENLYPDLEYRPTDYVLNQIKVDDPIEAQKIIDRYILNYRYTSTIHTLDNEDMARYHYMVKKFNIKGTPDWERSLYNEKANGRTRLLLVYPGDHDVDLIIWIDNYDLQSTDGFVLFYHPDSAIWNKASELFNLSQIFDDDSFLKEEQSTEGISFYYIPNDYILNQIQTTGREFLETKMYYDLEGTKESVGDHNFFYFMTRKFNISSNPDWERSMYYVRRDDIGRLLLVYPGNGVDLIITQKILNGKSYPEGFFHSMDKKLLHDAWNEYQLQKHQL